MQQLGALCLGGGFSIRLRWVISELNVADGPSRGQIKAGPFECGLPKTFEGSVFEGAAEPCDKEETSSIKQGSESSIAHCHGEEAGEDNDKGGEWQSQVATEQGNQDFSQSEHQQERGRNFARNNHMTLLERCSVSANIESQYGDYYQKFLNFCRGQGLDPPPSPYTDAYLSDLMDVIFFWRGNQWTKGRRFLPA